MSEIAQKEEKYLKRQHIGERGQRKVKRVGKKGRQHTKRRISCNFMSRATSTQTTHPI